MRGQLCSVIVVNGSIFGGHILLPISVGGSYVGPTTWTLGGELDLAKINNHLQEVAQPTEM